MDNVKYWIVPVNPERFRIHDYLRDFDLLELYIKSKFEVGDLVFLYCTAPEKQIRYMMRVIRTDEPPKEWIDDRAYSNRPQEELNSGNDPVCRFQLLKENTTDRLGMTDLKNHGFDGFVKGPRCNYAEETLEYILSVFDNEHDNHFDYEALENPDTIYEGAKKTIVVNSYERDRNAREMCIKAHGSRCSVCGLDFEKMYGERGKGFIHVHHKIPIATIGKEYELDPVKDLVPVCPNCHAMLHRHGNQDVLSVEELRDMVNRKGSDTNITFQTTP